VSATGSLAARFVKASVEEELSELQPTPLAAHVAVKQSTTRPEIGKTFLSRDFGTRIAPSCIFVFKTLQKSFPERWPQKDS
jgi:hypothetical protein